MSKSPDLQHQARDFAGEISRTLNQTVTDGIRMKSVLTGSGCIVGYEISKPLYQPEPIPLSPNGKSPRLWLYLMHTLALDAQGEYLTALRTTFSVQLAQDSNEALFSYDYDREPANKYPGAHMHVAAQSEDYSIAISSARAEPKKIADIHFPVGGKRYRPILEDIVEMLIIEGMVDARPGWEKAVDEGRSLWYKRQLRAAVRADPETARQELNR